MNLDFEFYDEEHFHSFLEDHSLPCFYKDHQGRSYWFVFFEGKTMGMSCDTNDEQMSQQIEKFINEAQKYNKQSMYNLK